MEERKTMVIEQKTYTYVTVKPYTTRKKAVPRIHVYARGTGRRGEIGNIPLSDREEVNKANVLRLVLRKKVKPHTKDKPEIREAGEWYRVQSVHNAYATDPGTKTPKAIAEIRIFVYTREPGRYDRSTMDTLMERVRRDPKYSFRKAGASIRFEIEGHEEELVDSDEVDSSKVDRPYYEVMFFDKKGNIKPGGKDEGYV